MLPVKVPRLRHTPPTVATEMSEKQFTRGGSPLAFLFPTPSPYRASDQGHRCGQRPFIVLSRTAREFSPDDGCA